MIVGFALIPGGVVSPRANAFRVRRGEGLPAARSHLLPPAHSGRWAAHAPVQPVRAHLLRPGRSQHPVQRPLPQSQPKDRQAPIRRPGQRQGLRAGLRPGVHVLVQPHQQIKKGRCTTRTDRAGAGRIEGVP